MTDSHDRFLLVLLRHLVVDSPAQVPPEAALRMLGLNSMRAVDLVVDLEEEFGFLFTDDLFTDETFATAESLWRAVGGLLPDRVSP
jgi:acyl carrier protein